MSTTTFSPPLHIPIPVSSISPQLLHSPDSSPEAELNQYLDNFPTMSESLNTYNYPTITQPTTNAYYMPTTAANTTKSVVSPGGMVTVYSYTPSSGQRDTCITTYIDFSSTVQGAVRLRLVFGDAPRPTVVEANSDRPYTQTQGDWTLKAYVPSIEQVSAHTAEMTTEGRLEWPLIIQALDSNNTLLDSVVFGTFSYDDYSDPPSPSSPASTFDYHNLTNSPAKRLQTDTNYPLTLPAKRAATSNNDTVDFGRLSVTSDTQPYLVSNPLTRVAGSPPSYMSTPSNRSGRTISPKRLTQQMSLSSSLPQSSSSLTNSGTRKRSRSSPVTNASTMPSSLPSGSGATTSLKRTSQLGNQIASEPAIVVLRNDLETMKHSWTENESKAHRRLVQFWKRQSGNRLEISFAAVPQSSYKENTIVVSCIYREDVDDYFITSVDVIYLLESLTGSRFEVEEKNRIRRNLEGFKPLTVSKTKLGTEDFFRVIMEFPPPRPRNIEKDVKVFEWSKLKGMLDKVFSKYSSIPSSDSSSSEAIASPDIRDVDLIGSDSEDKKPVTDNLSSKATTASHSTPNDAQTQSQQNPNLTYPSSAVDQTSPMQITSEADYYEGIPLSASDAGVGVPMAVAVKTEYPANPLFPMSDDQSNSSNGSLGETYEPFRAKSPASSDNSPLSAALSISSAGSSDNGIIW